MKMLKSKDYNTFIVFSQRGVHVEHLHCYVHKPFSSKLNKLCQSLMTILERSKIFFSNRQSCSPNIRLILVPSANLQIMSLTRTSRPIIKIVTSNNPIDNPCRAAVCKFPNRFKSSYNLFLSKCL